MHLEGTFTAKSAQDRVYAFFLDPEQISGCIDDPHTLEVQDPDHFTGSVKTGVGFIKGTFNVNASVVERTPPTRARLKVHGAGMGSGFDIEATLDVSAIEEGTAVHWIADVVMNGPIASMGARLMHGTIDKKTNAFFDHARRNLERP